MTLDQILKGTAAADPLNTYIYVDGNCVWDYKGRGNSIALISEAPCIEKEKVSIQELINFASELNLPDEVITLECELTNKELNTFKWEEEILVLYF